jgi:hypothetical protein
MPRISFDLNDTQYNALKSCAEEQLRDPDSQAKALVLTALKLWKPAEVTSAPKRPPRPPRKAAAVTVNGSSLTADR